MNRFISPLLPLFSFALALLLGCNEDSKPSNPGKNCPDQHALGPASASRSGHKAGLVSGRTLASLDSIRFAPKDSLDAFFGGKEVKLAFTLHRRLYLVEWGATGPVLTDLTAGDESFDGREGNINSPLFSPDGAWLAYGGSLSKPAVSFVRQALPGDAPARRMPVDTAGYDAFDPHWVVEGDKTWIWFATDAGPVSWSDRCAQMGGSTYKAQLLPDSSLGTVEVTGLPGSFKGGLSKDLRWAGTSYGPSALYDREARQATLLAGLVQQCNPSMNPYPPGSRNADHMMILGFGGLMKTVAGDVTENVHENLWIYGKGDRIVWRGRLPPDAKYQQWQKPEWSTHPDYATAVALHDYKGGVATKGDLYAVRIGDLADYEGADLAEAQGHFKLAEGRFTESSFSHLWVGP